MTNSAAPTEAPRLPLLKRLREFAVHTGLRWSAVASLIGVTPATLSRWQSGRSLPSEASAQLAHHRLDILYAADASTGLFRDLHDMTAKEKETALRGALYKSTP